MVGLKGRDKEILSGLKTESRSPRTLDLDLMSVGGLLTVMNEEDKNIIKVVKRALPWIQEIMEAVICALNRGGRLIYAGAGTSGRLGILDTAECLPTFPTMDEVVGITAEGEKAFVHAREGVEDSKEEDRKGLGHLKVDGRDVVVTLLTPGYTPYCIDALECTGGAGAYYVGLPCNRPIKLADYSDVTIEVDAGPKILTGSTRLKADTVGKIILNMISTAAMVGTGKVYGNLMVNMQAINLKLVERARRVMSMTCSCTEETAQAALELVDGGIEVVVVMILTGVTAKEAKERPEIHKGFVRKCLGGTRDRD